MTKEGDRRTFLKIGAGVVAGAVVAGVATDAYLSSVIGSNNSSSSSAVASLSNQLASTQNELSSTQGQLSSTAAQLSSAQAQAASLSGQLSSTQAQLTSANSALTSVSSQLTSTQQALTSANSQVTTLNSQVTSLNSELSLANSHAFQFFQTTEIPLVAAIASTMIPTDSNGPGANEAGVIYFLDGQLAGDYGTSANMYFQGPWIQPSTAGPLTVDGVTYSGGSAPARLTAGGGFQYPLTWQNFWRNCLTYTEAYANSAYRANFEDLSAANQTACLTDLWNNKPTNFNGIVPQAWFSELHDMVWAGFFTDPLYGGNQGMVSWKLMGFSGTNQGDAYGEGYTTKELMLMTTPFRLQPQSLTEFQIAAGQTPAGSS